MTYFPPNPRRRAVPRRYRQRFDPIHQGRREHPLLFSNQQPRNAGFGHLSNHLNTMMGHVGTITNGVHMLRQMGSLFSLFR